MMDLTKINELSTINSQLRTIFSLSSPMAKLQNCDGVLNDLSRNADRPAVFTLRKRGSETWSYADLDGWVHRLAAGLRHAGLARGDRAAIPAGSGPVGSGAARAGSRSEGGSVAV